MEPDDDVGLLVEGEGTVGVEFVVPSAVGCGVGTGDLVLAVGANEGFAEGLREGLVVVGAREEGACEDVNVPKHAQKR